MSDLAALAEALSDRYTIERDLGAGGMATVYVAEDVKHNRKVAIKVLRPELAAVLGPDRFLREITITANLNHPHILPLLDSGCAEEQPSDCPDCAKPRADRVWCPSALLYYVMPYVEGESLRERLNREKQLPIEDALTIATEVADALGSAHRQGVVHRDIKPENILLREGHAVVADFGIALAVTSAGGERLTETGLSLGTPAYMSPEQVAGERDIDARSDIYSLACVLYEMLAGDPPFVASTPRAVLARHVTDPVPPITTVRLSVPVQVVSALNKALEKAPADRYESADQFSAALFAEAKVAGQSVESIAVLPFENMSADPENEYFCDGLTEAIINAFTTIEDFKVVARTSAFSFKGKDVDIREIGRQLDVKNVLEGSVQKAGNRLRITAQLIDVSNGYHLWSERFDKTMDDVFAVQDEISLAIADKLQLQLIEGERARLVKRHTNDSEAYNLYLKGRYFYRKRTKPGFDKSIHYYELAIRRDPTFALPYAGMADTYLAHGFYNMMPQGQAWDRAKPMALKAIELDEAVAEAHTSLALGLTWCEYDFESGGKEHRKAVQLGPSDAEAHHNYAHFLAILGNFDEALLEMSKALDLEPLSVDFSGCVGQILYQARRSDAAIQKLEESIEIDPSYPLHYWFLGKAYLQQRMHEKAVHVLEKAAGFPSVRVMATAALGYAHAIAGEEGKAREILEHLLKEAESRPVDQFLIALIYTGLGDEDSAVSWLGEAYNAASIHLPAIGFESLFDPLREHPGFVQLLSRMRLPDILSRK